MEFILYNENDKIMDVFESKKELLDYVENLVSEHNRKETNLENTLPVDNNTIGDCLDILYGFGYKLELR